ncbi:EpsG family protein [Empedobacter falsenii]
MLYIFLILLFLNSFLELVFFQTFLRKILWLFSIGLLFIFQFYLTWTPDLESYLSNFNYYNDDLVRKSAEPLFLFLSGLIKESNGDFTLFMSINYMIILSILSYLIYKFSPLPAFVCSIYLLIPFIQNVIQMRFFMGFVFFMLAVFFYIKNKKIFILFFILGCLSHLSIILFVVLFFIRKYSFFKDYKKCNLILLLVLLILIVIPLNIIAPILNFFNPKYLRYLELYSLSRSLGTIALFIPIFLLNNYCLYKMTKSFDYKGYSKCIPVFRDLIQFSNFLLIPQFFVRDIWRMSMNLTVFCVIYLSIYMYIKAKRDKNEFVLLQTNLATLLWVIFTFNYILVIPNGGEFMKVVDKMIESNVIFNQIFN